MRLIAAVAAVRRDTHSSAAQACLRDPIDTTTPQGMFSLQVPVSVLIAGSMTMLLS